MKYYVHTQTDNQGDHEVHTELCTHLPREQNREYLGNFIGCESAVLVAKNRGYTRVNGCRWCCERCHTS